MGDKKGTPLWKALLSEHRLPWRYTWVKSIIKVNPTHYVKFVKRLDYSAMGNVTPESKANRNNELVYSMILQLYGEKFLEETLQICKKLKIAPFLMGGTMLGHYRDKGFIKHDTDIDLGLFDFSQIDLLKKEMKKNGCLIRVENEYSISFFKPCFPSLRIDFFRYYKKRNKWVHSIKEKNKLHTVYFPSDIFDDLVETKFLNRLKILMPKKAEKYLTIVYGKDWRIPKKEFEYAHKYHIKKLNK